MGIHAAALCLCAFPCPVSQLILGSPRVLAIITVFVTGLRGATGEAVLSTTSENMQQTHPSPSLHLKYRSTGKWILLIQGWKI